MQIKCSNNKKIISINNYAKREHHNDPKLQRVNPCYKRSISWKFLWNLVILSKFYVLSNSSISLAINKKSTTLNLILIGFILIIPKTNPENYGKIWLSYQKVCNNKISWQKNNSSVSLHIPKLTIFLPISFTMALHLMSKYICFASNRTKEI